MNYFLSKFTFRGNILLFFVFVGLMLVIPQYSFASVQSRYDSYKVELRRLQEDAKKSQLRHYWLNLAEDFYSLYEKNPTWANRTAALYRAGEAYDELAKRSFAKPDREIAIKYYTQVYKEFPNSVLADDALYSLAVLYNEQLKDSTSASTYLQTLLEKYPKADYAKKAKEYAESIDKTLTASLNLNLDSLKTPMNSHSERVIYHGLRAYKRNDIVQLRVELDASKRKNNLVTWAVEFEPAREETNSPPRLILTLNNTTTAPDTKPGHKYQDMGIVSKYVVDYSKRNSTIVIIDFDELAAYYAYFDKASSSIIIETTSNAKKLTKGISTKNITKKSDSESAEQLARDFAIQMGLNVKTIVIDPGHGGKDPGAVHNGITEKNLVLTLARQLGDELEKLGFAVKYTREADEFLTLSQRARIAEEYDADLFISVHTNAAENKKLAGVETYYLDYTNSTSEHVALRENGEKLSKNLGKIDDVVAELALRARLYESERLATFVQRNMYGNVNRKGFDVQNGGIKGSVFRVLDESSMPGILLEVGYISNNYDAKNLKNNAFIRSLAHGVAQGVNAYVDDLNLAKNTK